MPWKFSGREFEFKRGNKSTQIIPTAADFTNQERFLHSHGSFIKDIMKPSVESLRTSQDIIKYLSCKLCPKFVIKLSKTVRKSAQGWPSLVWSKGLWSCTESQTIPGPTVHPDVPHGQPWRTEPVALSPIQPYKPTTRHKCSCEHCEVACLFSPPDFHTRNIQFMN